MKKMADSQPTPTDPHPDIQPEYQLDYRKAKPNRFANSVVVVLDPDVAQVFTSAETVNAVLRALIQTMPKTPTPTELNSP